LSEKKTDINIQVVIFFNYENLWGSGKS